MTANVAILSNKKGGEVQLYFSANGYALCTGNAITSNVNGTNTCLAIYDEVINSMSIREIIQSTSNSSTYWTVSRGANTYFNLTPSVIDYNFASMGMGFSLDSTANVNVTLNGGGVGFLILKMNKQSIESIFSFEQVFTYNMDFSQINNSQYINFIAGAM